MAGKIELKAPLNGVVTIEPEDTASNFTVTIPAGNAELFSQSNIVGTVSESSGVPTGAIIERGSNANGEYVKYADGTLICTSTGVTLNNNTTWTFPSVFAIDDIAIGGAVGTSNPRFGTFGSITASSATVYVFQSDTGASAAGSIRAMAIARWF